jgi:hypothetical protein
LRAPNVEVSLRVHPAPAFFDQLHNVLLAIAAPPNRALGLQGSKPAQSLSNGFK